MPHRLAQHLISRGLLPASAVDEALKRLAAGDAAFDTVLLETGLISEEGMLQAMADVSGVRLVNLADFEPNRPSAQELPQKIAQRLNVVPLSVDANTLHLAVGYPVPHTQLKEVGFLLGKQLELWVSVEARRRDWLAQLYGVPLHSRFAALMAALDPSRKAAVPDDEAGTVTESLSREVLDRIAQGIVEEPVLLQRKKPASHKPTLEVVDEAELDEDDEATSIVEQDAYAAWARQDAPPDDEESQTSVIDLDQYEAFAREMSKPGALPPSGPRPPRPPVKVPAVAPVVPVQSEPWKVSSPGNLLFPGGVLPPRTGERSPSTSPPTAREVRAVERVTAAPAARPAQSTLRPSSPTAIPPPMPVSALSQALPAPTDDETDFSDVRPSSPSPRAQAPGTAPFGKSAPAPDLTTRPTPPEPFPLGAGEQPPPPIATATAAPRPTPPLPAQAPEAPAAAAVAPSSAVPPGLTSEWTLASARAALKQASHDREQLVDVVLSFGRRVFDYVSAFAVVRGAAYGWDARGEGDVSVIGQVAIPLDAASVFRTVALTRGSYVGPLPPDALTQHYLSLLGRTPRTVFLWPVEVKSRLVAIFYGDCAHRPMSQRKLSDFILFCQELPAAFGELILYRKQRGTAPALAGDATGLGQTGTDAEPLDPSQADAEWFAGLLTLLTGPDPNERVTAMAELTRTPEASAHALARAFPGPTAWSRLPVVELPEADELGPIPGALARLGQAGAAALSALLDADDSDTRYLALLTAGALPFPEVVDGVLRGLFDLEPDISSAARAAATALKREARFAHSLKALRQELIARDPLRRSLAARALGVLHDREAVEGLINLAGSDDALCSQSASEALKEITRANFGNQPRAWMGWWAQAQQKRRAEWLVDALESDDFDLRLSAIDELARTLGDNLGFIADAPEAERGAAVHRWREFLAEQPMLEV